MKKNRKKVNNKGFSLVELIIVIAIMAILSGALAPQLIKYLDKSRKAADVQTAQTIATAVNTALTDEAAYNLAYPSTGTSAPISLNTILSDSSPDALEKELQEILGKNTLTPKFKASTYTHYEVVFNYTDKTFKVNVAGSGSTVSRELYPVIDPAYK